MSQWGTSGSLAEDIRRAFRLKGYESEINPQPFPLPSLLHPVTAVHGKVYARDWNTENSAAWQMYPAPPTSRQTEQAVYVKGKVTAILLEISPS